MIIFLYGTDSHRLNQYRQELIERYQVKYASGMNLIQLDGSTHESIEQLTAALKNTTFFDEVKLIVLKDPFATKQIADTLHAVLVEQDARTRKDVVILALAAHAPATLKQTHRELAALLQHTGNTVHEFSLLEGAALARWVTHHLKEHNTSIASDALQTLIARVGTSTQRIAQELTKLVGYTSGKQIERKDVEILVGIQEEQQIFALVDAFAGKQRSHAYSLLYQALHQGQDPYYILTMFTYQMRNIVAVQACATTSSTDIARRLGMHPYVARKTLTQARQFTPEEAKDLFSGLITMEHRVKAGEVHLEDQLYLLLG